MITVKISSADNFPLLRQLPKNNPSFENIRFVYNEPIEECDYWIVFDKLPASESCICAPENIVFIAGEPPTVKHYRADFLSQFSKVISCDQSIKHKGLVLSHPFLPWLAGVKYDKELKQFRNEEFWTYDDFKIGQFSNKTKLISVITSNKTLTRGHRKRLEFVYKLKDALGDKLDIYGSGFNDIPDKMDALKDYKYSVIIENSKHPNYWTEKIADAFLCETFPIYFGCQNIGSFFPINSFAAINIHKHEIAIAEVIKILNDDLYTNSISELRMAKNRIMNDYNPFFKLQDKTAHEIYKKSLIFLKPEAFSIFDRLKRRIRWAFA